MEEETALRWAVHSWGGMQSLGKTITPDADVGNKKGISPDQQRLGAGQRLKEEFALGRAMHLRGGMQILGKERNMDLSGFASNSSGERIGELRGSDSGRLRSLLYCPFEREGCLSRTSR